MTEWKPVVGYEGYYEISSDGQVRSLDRKDSLGRPIKGRVLRAGPHTSGYKCVALCKDGKPEQKTIHRLVAGAFLGDSDLQVNHINGDKTDNRLENLEYATREQNMQHAWSESVHPESLSKADRFKISYLYKHGMKICDIARHLDINYWRVSKMARGVTYA